MNEPKRPVLPSTLRSAAMAERPRTTPRASNTFAALPRPAVTVAAARSPAAAREPTRRTTLHGLGPIVARRPPAADVTADILTPPVESKSSRATLKMASFSSLLEADRHGPRSTLQMLAHPWFSSEASDDAVEIWQTDRPLPRLVLSASVALLACAVLAAVLLA